MICLEVSLVKIDFWNAISFLTLSPEKLQAGTQKQEKDLQFFLLYPFEDEAKFIVKDLREIIGWYEQDMSNDTNHDIDQDVGITGSIPFECKMLFFEMNVWLVWSIAF